MGGPTTFGCTLHFRGSPLGEDCSANAPDDADTRGLTASSSRLAVLSKQLLWISHTVHTLVGNIQVTLHLGISFLVRLLVLRQAGNRSHDFPCGISDRVATIPRPLLKFLGKDNLDLRGIFLCHPFSHLFWNNFPNNAQTKIYPADLKCLVEYSSSKVSGPSEVPRSAGKSVF